MADKNGGRLALWDPFRQLTDIHDEIGRWWDRDWWPWPAQSLMRRPTVWAPRVDMYEEDGDIVVKAELPGIQRSDIEVTVEDNDLILKGERKSEKEVKEENYYRLERVSGTFYRRIPMPSAIDADKIKAKFQDGVLEVRVAKPLQQEKPKGKQITVS